MCLQAFILFLCEVGWLVVQGHILYGGWLFIHKPAYLVYDFLSLLFFSCYSIFLFAALCYAQSPLNFLRMCLELRKEKQSKGQERILLDSYVWEEEKKNLEKNAWDVDLTLPCLFFPLLSLSVLVTNNFSF